MIWIMRIVDLNSRVRKYRTPDECILKIYINLTKKYREWKKISRKFFGIVDCLIWRIKPCLISSSLATCLEKPNPTMGATRTRQRAKEGLQESLTREQPCRGSRGGRLQALMSLWASVTPVRYVRHATWCLRHKVRWWRVVNTRKFTIFFSI